MTTGTCSYNNTQVFWKNIGSMDWRTCIRLASKYGAGLGPSDLTVTFGWRAHRYDTNAATYGPPTSYSTASIQSPGQCVLVRDSRYTQNDNAAQLSDTVVFDGQTWHYQDYGDQYADECDRLAAKAGAMIITPWTIGLTPTGLLWRMRSMGCNEYAYMTSAITGAVESVSSGGRSSMLPCMVGYVDN
eukprot:TRINITY_DN4450_c2_g1_i3.p1 TRINITY_DN4450_c2_g1~~TRINITY_DN4450_c2_g1_i3.p1  ORF type:complete len:187 (-),score=22.90 TRINITY_DN4450_c2_g1_i3:310-870(-)